MHCSLCENSKQESDTSVNEILLLSLYIVASVIFKIEAICKGERLHRNLLCNKNLVFF